MPVTRGLMRAISPSRIVAFDVLESVAAGAYASDALRDASRRLTPRDAALAVQIVFGCLRHQGQLDYLIRLYSGRHSEQLDLEVLITLRAAIFQLRYLERIPAHAAVHDSVEFIKTRKRAAVGLTNAVLRKVTREPVTWPDEATELSIPSWLLDRWDRQFGREAARGIAQAALREPLAYIRASPGVSFPPGMKTEPTQVAGAYRLLSALPGGVRLQDISSQSIIPLLGLSTGQSYLDLCAAPGNKTLQALETPLKLAVACDVSENRIREIPPVCPRVVLDATQPLPFNVAFDTILIDAPCSGTGTLARNPEIKWRLVEGDLARFQRRQTAILEQALTVLRPGGRLVYATCSLEPEENELAVEQVLAKQVNVRCERSLWRLPGREEGDGFYAAAIIRNT